MRNYRKLKTDKLARDIFRKLDSFNHEEINDSHDNYDDDYYIRINKVPPRFELYRQARWEKLDELAQLTFEGLDHTITLDELNFGLKRELAMTPEQRYQHRKDSLLYDYEDIEHGRIEDQQIIEEHDRLVDRLKQENRIIEPPSESELIRLRLSK